MIGILRADEYYQSLRPGPILSRLYSVGQIFWAPILFLPGQSRLYVVRGAYSAKDLSYKYSVEPARSDEFDGLNEPIQPLGIRSNERPLVVGAKRRPVVLVSRQTARWSDLGRTQDESYLVAPIYSFGGDETKLSYSPAMVERVKAYVYWQLFYLPASREGRVKEGFARLDRIQPVHKDLLEQRPVMLSDDARTLLQSWIRVYFGEELDSVDDVLFDYREQAMADLKTKGLLP